MSEEKFKKIISHAKEYGFIFQSSEIYDGLSSVYDYGQNGVLLKNNIKSYWWKSMINMNDNIVGLDSAIFSHPTTWKASGHLDAFNDPLIDNKDSKKRYRADNLIEEFIDKIQNKLNTNTLQIISTDGTIEIDNAGSYDTAKGTVTLTGFTPTAFEGSEIIIEAAPANQSTVRPLRNYILDIDPTSASVALLDFQNTAVTL